MHPLILATTERVELPIKDQLFNSVGTIVKIGKDIESEGTEIPGVIGLRLLGNPKENPAAITPGFVRFQMQVMVYISSMLPANVRSVHPDTLQYPKLLLVLAGETCERVRFGLATYDGIVESRYENADISLLTRMVQKLTVHVDQANITTATLEGICRVVIEEEGCPRTEIKQYDELVAPYPMPGELVPEEEAKLRMTDDKKVGGV